MISLSLFCSMLSTISPIGLNPSHSASLFRSLRLLFYDSSSSQITNAIPIRAITGSAITRMGKVPVIAQRIRNNKTAIITNMMYPFA